VKPSISEPLPGRLRELPAWVDELGTSLEESLSVRGGGHERENRERENREEVEEVGVVEGEEE